MFSLERIAIAGGVTVALLAGAYWKGRSDCGARQSRIREEAAREWADRTASSLSMALRSRLDAQQEEARDRLTLDEITRAARAAVGADDLCVPADTVERLRQLRDRQPAAAPPR